VGGEDVSLKSFHCLTMCNVFIKSGWKTQLLLLLLQLQKARRFSSIAAVRFTVDPLLYLDIRQASTTTGIEWQPQSNVVCLLRVQTQRL